MIILRITILKYTLITFIVTHIVTVLRYILTYVHRLLN